MNTQREYFIKGARIGLAKRIEDDHRLNYENWLDLDMQKNFNHVCRWQSLEEYLAFFCSPSRPKQRFVATIICLVDEHPIGNISLAPESLEPDLSICLYSDFRGKGFGTKAFDLAVKYVFENYNLDFIVAGAYEHNIASIKMLKKLGFRHDDSKDSIENNEFGDGRVRQLAFRLDKDEWNT